MPKVEKKISVKNVEINGEKFIQVLVPDYVNNAELLELTLSGSGNSFSYANTREAVGHLTVQVNAYVKKDTMELIKAHQASEEAKVRLAAEIEDRKLLDKKLEVLNSPAFIKFLEQQEAEAKKLANKAVK